ncbi:MAG: transposase [Pseudomonadales bacterium]|nr:transposase [Pseudomonadales bacterium]
MTALLSDSVNSKLLGMSKVVSDDSARRALKKIPEQEGIEWLQDHLRKSYQPLLTAPWILDSDVTIKPIYGHQEGAEVGYNPHKPGRPSHTLHTYMMANLRLVLDVEVQPGKQGNSSCSAPGLIGLLDQLPISCWPAFVRGDCDWGSGPIMTALEEINMQYLFKLRKSKNVQKLIIKHHALGQWQPVKPGWEAKEDQLKLHGWKHTRRVVIVRHRVEKDAALLLETQVDGQQSFGFINEPENMKLYAYSVLVTSLDDDLVTVFQHYRDRADCENVFDEIKNQWGWGGYTTRDLKSSRLMSRIIALVYNWWSLFSRMANPDAKGHQEAITSRPLMLTSVGRLTTTGKQKTMTITSQHGRQAQVQAGFQQMGEFFNALKQIAPQLSSVEYWTRRLSKELSPKAAPDRRKYS